MKIKKDWTNTMIYTITCILTFGFAWIQRVIITQAIKESFEE
jgi:hypothetical protein